MYYRVSRSVVYAVSECSTWLEIEPFTIPNWRMSQGVSVNLISCIKNLRLGGRDVWCQAGPSTTDGTMVPCLSKNSTKSSPVRKSQGTS